jgi:hypothetical protein
MAGDLAMADKFSLTDEQERQIRQWEKDRESLQREITDRQAKLSEINDMLKAVAVLRTARPVEPIEMERANGSAADLNMVAAIERIAATSAAPLTKAEIKERLAAEHFPQDRLGPYFYTCIMRLKAKERIKVLGDGRVWKP